ncbi:NACHT, LRR and PYD domains-containing protein 1b allele 3-like isoform X2 [Brienomyrus brachyistius]|uniref:NACHT, LRR and PYD domains-containing protein 1b allele 3-like isoform X2 n=1 Tax=Brienomyrus brachyistius TaxID=42636 RepID=UPI0020B27EE9|nr:NACHT, LRR and PYD domains-containing protein 1b allele 3-like isoform X2 [Brienomyrus brachyistius]
MEDKTGGTQESPETSVTMEGKTEGTQRPAQPTWIKISSETQSAKVFIKKASESLPSVNDASKPMRSERKPRNICGKPSSPEHHRARASTSATINMHWVLELVSGNEHLFTPDVVETSNKTEYRFQVKHPGRFFCRVTGLGFVVESGGEVTYSFCSWEKAPQTPSSWSPAGPIFDIECPQGTLKELHLPHCEMTFADENLAVAHVTEDNVEILQPLEVRGQVLLLLRPGDKILNVFLLPLNVPPDQVHQQMQQRQNLFIPTSSMCTLIHKELYRMSSDHEAIRRIQPENEEFEYSFDQTIHPTFEVFLNRDVVEVDLSVLQDRSGKDVWRRFIDLTGHGCNQVSNPPLVACCPPAHDLLHEHSDKNLKLGAAFVDQHKQAIIQKVTLIKPILDEIPISEEKYNYICAASTSQDRMRRLYEVLNSDTLKMLFFASLKKKEPHLVSELKSS